jgi:hypothetical protein
MGFKGTFTEVRASLVDIFHQLVLTLASALGSQFRQDPVITVYEAAPNPADHLKIRGTETGRREA